jgi:hypothetical protein
MVSKQAVEEQLKRIGCNFRFWGRSEVNELGRILMEDEIIAECVNGEYANGFAMLVATNHRLLLVDKKPFLYLTVEDYRYEMITEFNYNHRLMNSTINIYTTNKTLTFTSWNQHRLRKLLEYIQSRVLEMRQQQHLGQQFQAAAAAQYAQLHAARSMQFVPAQQQQQPQGLPAAAQIQPQSPQAQPALGQQQAAQPLSPQQIIHGLSTKRMARGLASGRAALGTYTRSKLPSFRRLQLGSNRNETTNGYESPGQLSDYNLPYEYES